MSKTKLDKMSFANMSMELLKKLLKSKDKRLVNAVQYEMKYRIKMQEEENKHLIKMMKMATTR